MVCTFFGHRDTPSSVVPLLNSTLVDLIENKKVDSFYVGNQGNFDNLVYLELQKLKKAYPHIRYAVTLAYFPGKKDNISRQYDSTLYPDGLEAVPRRFAISKRNLFMIEKSDYVVTYVKYLSQGASQFKELAEKKGKVVINLI